MQHDYSLDNQPGAAFRADLNDALQSLVGLNSGNTAPAVTYPYMWWMDESGTPALLKQRNGDNTAWMTLAAVVDGELVPYSAGESADDRYVRQSDGARLRRITKFETSGVYEKPDWLKFAIVEGVGAGGGGGGSIGSSDISVASGGGAGGPFRFQVLADDLGASEIITVGTGGGGGEAGNNDGSSGGTTSFGAHATGTGGGGGASTTEGGGTAHAPGGEGGSTSYGDSAAALLPEGIGTGEWAAHALRVGGEGIAMPSNGASSIFGAGGRSIPGVSSSNADAGLSAVSYGAGGGGSKSTTASAAGGDGAGGVVIIYEYE